MREVLRLAVPAIVTGLLGTAVFLADRMMLARYDDAALASMQLQGPLLWSISSVFMAVCAGTVALVARSTGAGDLARARAVARGSLRIAAGLGFAVGVLGILGLDGLVSFFGPPELALRQLSASYLEITLAALPAAFVVASASMILAGSGDTRTPLVAGLLANGTNIAINSVLIYGAELGPLHVDAMGVRGAAIGTAVAFAIEAAVLLVVLGRARHPLCVAGLWQRIDAADRQAMRDVLRISAPALLERILVHAGFLAFAKAITSLGPDAMAANQALITMESICFMCADGFGVAAATVIGQALGRGDPIAATRRGTLATVLGVASITTAGVLLWATGRWTLPWFVAPGDDGTALVATASAALPLLALAQPFMTTGIVLAMGLRGAGDTRSPLLAAVVGGLFVRVTLAWGLAAGLGLGLVGIWWASTIDWAVRTAWLVAVFRRGAWTRVRV